MVTPGVPDPYYRQQHRKPISVVSRAGLTVAALTGVGLALWAVALAVLPLPAVSFGLSTGTCGPGYSSESAVSVRLHPSSVNGGAAQAGFDTTTTSYQQQAAQFQDYCVGVADARLTLVAVLLAIGAALLVAVLVLASTRPRWL